MSTLPPGKVIIPGNSVKWQIRVFASNLLSQAGPGQRHGCQERLSDGPDQGPPGLQGDIVS